MADRVPGNAPIIATEGSKTNPSAATLMADTDSLPFDGLYQLRVIAGGSAAGSFDVQRRNAANDSTLTSLLVYTPAGASGEFVVDLPGLKTERFRVVMPSGLTGTAAASIQAEVIA